jgi:hypothetical protein
MASSTEETPLPRPEKETARRKKFACSEKNTGKIPESGTETLQDDTHRLEGKKSNMATNKLNVGRSVT